MRTLMSDETGGILARRLLLFVVALPILLGGMASAGVRLSLLSDATSIFFLTATANLSLGGLLLFNAFTINHSEQGRREAQLSLEESERAYRSLFENAGDPMFIIGEDLVVQETNSVAALCLGMASTAIRGRPMTDIATSCSSDMGRKLRLAFSDGQVSFESCARAEDGHDIPLEINARSVAFRGRPAVLIIARDLSERRRAERALAEKEGLLQQAQKMEAIGRLAGGVAHDFNNLLTVIMGYSELLLGKLSPQHEGRSDAFEIKVCAARAAALTRQLLAFSRRQPASPRATDVNTILEEMTPLLRRLIGENIGLDIRLQARQSSIRIDPNQLEQIVLNLAVNARDAMPDGGTLTIESGELLVDAEPTRFTPAPGAGAYVQLTVSDTGQGIAADVRPISSSHSSRRSAKRREPGSGCPPSTGSSPRTAVPLAWTRHSAPARPCASSFPAWPRRRLKPRKQRESPRVSSRRGQARCSWWKTRRPCADTCAQVCVGSATAYSRHARARRRLPSSTRSAGRSISSFPTWSCRGISGTQLAEVLVKRLPGVRMLFISGYDENGTEEIGTLCGRFDLITKPFTVTDLLEKLSVPHAHEAWGTSHVTPSANGSKPSHWHHKRRRKVMLKNLKFGVKIGGGFAILLLLLGVIAGVGYIALRTVQAKVITMKAAKDISIDILEARREEKNFIIRGGQNYIDLTLTAVKALNGSVGILDAAGLPSNQITEVKAIAQASKDYQAAFSTVCDGLEFGQRYVGQNEDHR